jgi:hypothetical protein
MRDSIRLAAAASVLLSTAVAHGQSLDQRRAAADALFNEGQQLLTAGQLPAACAKLEESQREDPKLGRLLNVAYCHERLHRTATAWSEYNQAAAVALQARQPERESFARGRAAELAAKLSFVRLDLQPGANLTEATIDGRAVPREQWTVPFPIDPGSHTLSFSAPGHRAQTQDVTVADAETVRVVVGPLDAMPTSDAPAATPTATPAPAPTAEQQPAPAPAPAPIVADTAAGAPSHTARTIGWILGGVGVAGLGVGTGFALHSLSLQQQADPMCPGKRCSSQGTSLISDATTAANVATAGFVVGLSALAAGAWLIIQPLQPSGSSSTRTPASSTVATRVARAGLAPYVAGDRAGLAVEGQW